MPALHLQHPTERTQRQHRSSVENHQKIKLKRRKGSFKTGPREKSASPTLTLLAKQRRTNSTSGTADEKRCAERDEQNLAEKQAAATWKVISRNSTQPHNRHHQTTGITNYRIEAMELKQRERHVCDTCLHEVIFQASAREHGKSRRNHQQTTQKPTERVRKKISAIIE